GFGDLLFDDGSGNQFCGRTVIEIASAVDSFVTFRLLSPDSVAMEYYTTVRMLNASFSGLIDTVSFASKLVLKGTRRLYEVPYLHLNPTGERTVIAESDLFIPQVPEQFSLEQNYPNPFNPSTMITFMMPEDGIVTLKVFDLLGREVASLVNREEMSAGEYDVEFVANNLVSGVYFYRITIETPNEEYDEENGIGGVNTFTQVRKLLLMK
ncbi:MAG: T9SS type A sorting domain-containing protein, partial [Bacteroidetes bacterium]